MSNRNQIHIPNLPAVEKYVRFYTGPGRRTILQSLERSRPYVPVMTEILESHGVPAELIAIVMVESCFKGLASYRGAGGYWQMLAGTARRMGLRVDRWVDERRDPIKSTEAAARYLRSFYDQYRSWPLAIAAYNGGERAVARTAGRDDEGDAWVFSRQAGLPGRTRTYVAKVLAAVQIMKNLEVNGFERPQYASLSEFETVWVPSSLKLEQVAKWLGVSLDDLRDLNPSLCLDKLPPTGGAHLNLPSGARDQFDLAFMQYSGR